ncbi:MAG: hypothetical protein ACJ8F7_20615, partial [Gemmataceae bacterium]
SRPPAARRRSDFLLRLADGDPVAPEHLRAEEGGNRHRLFFRLPTPACGTAATLCWKDHPLGQITLPVLNADDYLNNLRVEMPTIFVRLGEKQVACQTFVATQAKGFQATALIASRSSSLAPLADLGLKVVFRHERDGACREVPIPLSGSQLQAKQALITAVPHKLPRRGGIWTATWQAGGRVLATQRVKAISQRAFHKSLRISDTRFVVGDWKGVVSVRRQLPPLVEVSRMGPCFLVSSGEAGMAGLCTLRVHAQVPGGIRPPLLQEQEILLTDGPTMFAPGTLDVADLGQLVAFDLRLKNHSLGLLPLSPVPSASFTSEGGYKPPGGDYIWTSAADEELTERLNRLMNGR